MKNFKNILKKTLVFMAALALVPLTNASAATTILVDPYENIPKVGTSQLQVIGADLTPGRTVVVTQESYAPFSIEEGDPHNEGVKVERMHRGAFVVDGSGMLNAVVNVTYDPRPNFGTVSYCDTIQDLRRICILNFRYQASDDGTLPSEEITQQKLYFGMSGPVVTPPPASTPLTKDDCKDDKWSSFTSLGFKNQGACVSFVATNQ